VNTVAYVSCNDGGCSAGVDEAFVAFDGDFDVVFMKTTPEFLDKVDDGLFPFWGGFVTDV
jgi:hypothetical protein